MPDGTLLLHPEEVDSGVVAVIFIAVAITVTIMLGLVSVYFSWLPYYYICIKFVYVISSAICLRHFNEFLTIILDRLLLIPALRA